MGLVRKIVQKKARQLDTGCENRYQLGMPLPLTVLDTIDPVLRELATAGLLVDVPQVVIIQHDKNPQDSHFRRRISDYTGVLEDETVSLDGGCAGCLMRDDLLGAAVRVADLGRWDAMALVPKVGTPIVPLAQALAGFADQERSFDEVLDLRSITQLLDLSHFITDLMGKDLLVDRGLALNEHDRRSTNEVLCEQVELADLLVASPGTSVAAALLEQLKATGAAQVDGPHPPDWGLLFERLHCPERLQSLSPQQRMPSFVKEREGVWTIDLRSDSPLHPARILEFMQHLAASRVRLRGRFWLPGRPNVMVEWNGIGGQLSIGPHANPKGFGWGTRIVVTGLAPTSAEDLKTKFGEALVTDSELTQGLDYWANQDDGFDPWLGQRISPYAQHPQS
jgi:G3E family GTPase